MKLEPLRVLHWVAGKAMIKLGYDWEVRRAGELKLGLWRKQWRKRKVQRRLVVIPGFGDTPLSWLPVLGLLKKRIEKDFDEIILMDFPGFAGTLSHEKAFHSMELLKVTLFDALDPLRPQMLIGHSLGGWLAGLYAAECAEGKRPKHASTSAKTPYLGPEKMILLDASGLFATEQERDELGAKFRRAIEHKGDGYNHLKEFVFHKEPFFLKWVMPRMSRFFAAQEIQSFVDSFDESHLLTEERISKIHGDVWLVWGENDRLVPSSPISNWMHALNQGLEPQTHRCQAVLIKNCGHSPHLEAPARLALILHQILRGKHYLGLPATRRFWELVV